MKKITGYEKMEDGDVWLIFKGKDFKLISSAQAKKIGLEKDGKEWYCEMPVNKKNVEKLRDKFEKNGFHLKIVESEGEEVKPIKGKMLDAGLKILRRWQTMKDLSARARKDESEVKEEMEDFVYKHGVKTKPGTDDSILIIDSTKVQWQFNSRVKWDEDVALKWASDKKIRKKFEDLVETVEQINDDAWNKLKKEGEIPDKVLKKCEKATSFYKLMTYDLSESICSECGGKIKKKDKFCSECGTTLK